jgi:hypothetical protein
LEPSLTDFGALIEHFKKWAGTGYHATARILSMVDANLIVKRRGMKAIRVIRNILGSAGLLYAGYVLIASVKDVRRYIRISTM